MIMGSKNKGVEWVKDKLRYLFKLTDLGEISYYLEVTLKWKRNVIGLHQVAYFRRGFERFGMYKAKALPTPTVEGNDSLFEAMLSRDAGKKAVGDSHTGRRRRVYSTWVIALYLTLHSR